MKKLILLWLVECMWSACNPINKENLLWDHMAYEQMLDNEGGLRAEFLSETSVKTLHITAFKKAKYAWCNIPAPKEGWNLSRSERVEAKCTNIGDSPIKIMFWVDADHGWDAVADTANLAPNESRMLSCKLRATFPDGTPKINPNRVHQIQVMLVDAAIGNKVIVSGLKAVGQLAEWELPKGRLEVPNTTNERPKAGKRVKYQPPSLKGTLKYVVLYLPKDWKRGVKYPTIVEFPGNEWYTIDCHSSGDPEACVIGYGMSKGIGAIWVSMPFVDIATDRNVLNGWGKPDHTVDLTLETVNDLILKYGADKEKLFITGFSRGAIACGFIGLRNTQIGALWKGLHACQHFDGDGWGGADLESATTRLEHCQGAYFETDNAGTQPKQMLIEAGVDTAFANSGLGAHAAAMFLDNRASTQKVRKWFLSTAKNSQVKP